MSSHKLKSEAVKYQLPQTIRWLMTMTGLDYKCGFLSRLTLEQWQEVDYILWYYLFFCLSSFGSSANSFERKLQETKGTCCVTAFSSNYYKYQILTFQWWHGIASHPTYTVTGTGGKYAKDIQVCLSGLVWLKGDLTGGQKTLHLPLSR